MLRGPRDMARHAGSEPFDRISSILPFCLLLLPLCQAYLGFSVLFYSFASSSHNPWLSRTLICFVLSLVPGLLSALSVSSLLYQHYVLQWSQLDRIQFPLFSLLSTKFEQEQDSLYLALVQVENI